MTNESVGKVTKERSPLLPLRHEPDFFVCDVLDAAFKGDRASMEHPMFSLSKKPDMNTRRYQNGEQFIEVRPSSKGLATVFDRDVLIYCISQCISRLNQGLEVPATLRFKAYDLLVATNRQTSGRGYDLLKEAFDRLQGTQVETNIATGGREQMDIFSLVDRVRIIRETRDGRMLDVEVTLSDWVYQAIQEKEVLTLDRSYFQLARPLERRLYELARKHCGDQNEFRISMAKLHNKSGSQSTLKEFRRLIRSIIEDDCNHDHFPGYRLHITDEDIAVFKPKTDNIDLFASQAMFLSADTRDRAKALARGWDIDQLEIEWRNWVASKKIKVTNPDKLFLSFCKQRGPWKPGR